MTIDDVIPAKIRFNCRRGMGEVETVLLHFLDNHFTELTPNQQFLFSELLKAEDTELWDWLITGQSTPPPEHSEIVELIHNAA